MLKYIKVINVLLEKLNNLTAWRFLALLLAIISCVALIVLPELLKAAS